MTGYCLRLASIAGLCLIFLISSNEAFVSRSRRVGGWLDFLISTQDNLCSIAPSPPSAAIRSRSSRIFAASDESAAPIPTEWQGSVLQQLKSVIDPDLGADIVTLGFIKNLELDDRNVSFDVELTTPACPVKDQFQIDCQRLVEDLEWTEKVTVSMTAQETVQETETLGLSQVGAIIAVSSCKGGVGKSTTAVNLAYSLQKLGATVGIFDADVYGPSLPTMITPEDDTVRFVGRQVAPLQRNGVRLMSFGYVNDGSAVMRGPMVTQLLDQFMSVTHWGSLDYLVLDMPPGTGDIQLTLTQKLNITAAVIVTTPQELSFADVVRGVEMFDTVNVPSIAVVENMAYYEVDRSAADPSKSIDQEKLRSEIEAKLSEADIDMNGDGKAKKLAADLVQVVMENASKNKGSASTTEKIPIFGSGHRERLSKQWGIEHTFSVPLLENIAANGDGGDPFVLEHPDSPPATVYLDLAKAVVSEVAKTKFSNNGRPEVSYNADQHTLEIVMDDAKNNMEPSLLRRDCRCAACVEELTGRQVLLASSVSDSVAPLRMTPTGNYALSIDWSDGHRSLYPYRQIRALLEEENQGVTPQRMKSKSL